ncbi:Uncharacterised protein [Candidatus Anstonella stagnisolia]|nr:Uncharacterised protein [Candidatus Anstonella stagnisolia]
MVERQVGKRFVPALEQKRTGVEERQHRKYHETINLKHGTTPEHRKKELEENNKKKLALLLKNTKQVKLA